MSLEKDDSIKWVPIKELKPHYANSNKHPKEQIERLAKIIKYQGFRSPIQVSNFSGFIVVGHGRLEAAKQLGLTKVPVSYQDFDNVEQEIAHLNADNAVALWAQIDMTKVEQSIKDFDLDFDTDFLGFDGFERKEEKDKSSGLTEDDAVPETSDNELGVHLGDIYQLGDHRLMCGDSTCEDTVSKLMNGEKADMVFTSPPYCFGKAGFEEKGKYKNDKDKDVSKWLEMMNAYINTWNNHAKYIFNNIQFLSGNKPKFWDFCFENKDSIIDVMIWNKTNMPAMEKNILNSNFEFIFVHGSDNRTRHIKLGRDHRGKISNIFQQNRSKGEMAKEHRATFNVELPEFFIKEFEPKYVADPFLGSGSTLIACEKTDRKCYGMELDPHYCSVIIKRWQEYTGKEAVKLNV